MEGTSVIFSGELPATAFYQIDVDANQDGQWGMGGHDPTRKAGPLLPTVTTDFAYAEQQNGEICSAFILEASDVNPNAPYSTSACGWRQSKGRFHTTALAEDRAIKTYTIPTEELAGAGNPLHLVVEIWYGSDWYISGTPTDPILLNLGEPRANALPLRFKLPSMAKAADKNAPDYSTKQTDPPIPHEFVMDDNLNELSDWNSSIDGLGNVAIVYFSPTVEPVTDETLTAQVRRIWDFHRAAVEKSDLDIFIIRGFDSKSTTMYTYLFLKDSNGEWSRPQDPGFVDWVIQSGI